MQRYAGIYATTRTGHAQDFPHAGQFHPGRWPACAQARCRRGIAALAGITAPCAEARAFHWWSNLGRRTAWLTQLQPDRD